LAERDGFLRHLISYSQDLDAKKQDTKRSHPKPNPDESQFMDSWLYKGTHWLDNVRKLDSFIANYTEQKSKKILVILTKPKSKLSQFHINFGVTFLLIDIKLVFMNDKTWFRRQLEELPKVTPAFTEISNFGQRNRGYFVNNPTQTGLVLFSSKHSYRESEVFSAYSRN
jgi:hypothetical protein